MQKVHLCLNCPQSIAFPLLTPKSRQIQMTLGSFPPLVVHRRLLALNESSVGVSHDDI